MTRAGFLAAVVACAVCFRSSVMAQDQRAERRTASLAAVGAIIADRHVPDSTLDVHRRAQTFALAQRFQYLADWVLPGESHPTFRVTVDFTPAHPAPPVGNNSETDALRIETARQRGQTRVQRGSNLISPVLDLLATARELGTGKLDELRTRIETVPAAGEGQQRAKLALLALIELESGNLTAAHQHFDALYPLIEACEEHTLTSHSPELLAIQGANAHAQTRGFARDAAANLFVRAVRIPGRGPAIPWESHLMAMMAATRNLDRQMHVGPVDPRFAAEFSLEPQLAEWRPASRTTTASRGSGHSLPHWQRVGERIENACSHQDDFLYYYIPLQGDYQVECDLQTRDFQNTQLVVAGQWTESLYYSRDKYDYGNFRQRLGRADISPALTKYRDWVHMRVTVEGQVLTYYANGRVLHRTEVQGDLDPWIALRSDSRQDGSASDIRITGHPTVPVEFRLTASRDLTGWFPYFTDSVATAHAAWQPHGDLATGGGLVGLRQAELAGMHVERLLRYHRPMFEDGAIEYEFFYCAGESHVHPALDRLAFLLEPDGIRIHWVTDGEHERTTLAPDNVVTEGENRRGPDQLPLAKNDWNRLQLTLTGDVVTLLLNGQLVYQRTLEITNQRFFGLFHFADRTEARVRNVRWRGAWPRELPSVGEQELANHDLRFLDDQLPELTAVVRHNFATDGLPTDRFRVEGSAGGGIAPVADGLRVDRPGGNGHRATVISLNGIAAGDFDVVASFRQFAARPAADGISTAGVRVLTSDMNPQQCLVLRRFVREPRQEDRQMAQAVVRNGATETSLDWGTLYSDAQESDSGRLRIARRGERVYYLLAEGESPNFRLLGQTDVATGTLPRNGIQLLAQSSGGGVMSVVWHDIEIRANSISLVPAANAVRTLSVMNHDGSNLRRILPTGTQIESPGSPAWSPDGTKIAFDDYNGSTGNARMYLINVENSEIQELGVGNMPTFSPDGTRIVFSWGGNGVAVMNVDGTNRQVLDRSGWGAQWSGDQWIAYRKGRNIVVYDWPGGTQREILEGELASRYSSIYWNLGWSRDSRHVCFLARRAQDNQFEIAVAAVEGSKRGFQVLQVSDHEIHADFSWHPDGQRILLALPATGGNRLFTLNRTENGPGTPTLLPGQPTSDSIAGADWSPDGRFIAFTSRVSPE